MVKTPTLGLSAINVKGVVQGVGFRPFIYQLATRLNLKGWVCNTSAEVKIEVEGEVKDIDSFLLSLKEQAPPVSHNVVGTRALPTMSVKTKKPAGGMKQLSTQNS